MIEDDDHIEDENLDNTDGESESNGQDDIGGNDGIIPISGMYKDWFLDYASYVILERAVPALEDGLKPVQRRIFHSMKEMDDGRYNKVANIIGNTMKYHPHGDASIGDALVQLGQKEIAVDCQGNWGNTLTGDSAAAPRYIEARLSKFASEVMFNKKTTEWLASYDGRNKEPQYLPIKFPLLLAQGAEGIAVGLACKMLPHNFVELIDNSINYLRGRKVEIFPDFPHGGTADFSNYNDGLRGGKVRVRARISQLDKKTLIINEIPYGTTTTSLIDSVIKANEKGKIKIKKIEDNTAATAEILVHIASGVSPDKTIDALYAFTDCEVSISPNACVIYDNKPVFLGVSELLKKSTDNTVRLLKRELEIRRDELLEQWHFASLERIFIEKRIYRDIEEEETWEGVISAIDKGLKPHTKHLKRPVTEEDIVRLTEIKIKRISKFDSNKADEVIAKIEAELEEIRHHLDNLIDYAVDYFKHLKSTYSEGRERRTEIKVFDNISAKKVIVANKKLYVDKSEGFIGWSSRSLTNAEFIADCSEIDDVIIFRADGKMQVTKIADKKFVGKDILYAGIWKKGDERTIYHLIYQNGSGGPSLMKRFAVKSITRDKEYDLTAGKKGSKVHYFTVNPNGRKEVVQVVLRARPHLKKLKIDIDFSEQLIKGRGAKGNTVTKEVISKVIQKEVGGSTLAARKVWYDDVVNRLNDDGRGKLLGSFKGDDRILTIYNTGCYRLSGFELSTRFDDTIVDIVKWYPDRPISCVYYDGEKELYYVKRFLCEVTTDKMVPFIPENEGAELIVVSTDFNPRINIEFNKRLKETKNLPDKEESLKDFIDVKGMKAQGNQLTKLKVKEITLLPKVEGEDWPQEEEEEEIINEETADDDSGNKNSDAENNDVASSENPSNDDPDDKSDDNPKSDSAESKESKKEKAVTVEFEITNETQQESESENEDVDDKKDSKSKKSDDDDKGQTSLF